MVGSTKRRICLILLSVFVLASAGWAARAGAEDAPSKSIRMVIDYGDGVEKHFTQLSWSEDMTVLDALQAAAAHPRGIRFKYRGKGATAFLTQIDDLQNEGRERNWIFRVGDKLADRSFGIFTLKPGDAVLWKFGEYR